MPSFKNINLDTSGYVANFDGSLHTDKPTGNLSPVIFETNWENDAGYLATSEGLINQSNVPQGWDGVLATADTRIETVVGAGKNGSNAMRFAYGTNVSQPTASLIKHLTGKQEEGFDELYMRYHVKFPNKYKWGDGTGYLPYWKWFRLAQNTHPTDKALWTENRPDSYYVVGNVSGSDTYGLQFKTTFAGNDEDGTEANRSQGSAGGVRASINWYVTGNPQPHSDQLGYVNHVNGWDMDWETNLGRFKTYPDGTQDWHTIEYRIKAATAEGADDGILEMWFDGVNQGQWTNIVTNSNDTGSGDFTGVPTIKKGSGWNFMHLFDNMTEFMKDHGNADVDGWIDVSDFVISRQRIGHDYVAGAPQ